MKAVPLHKIAVLIPPRWTNATEPCFQTAVWSVVAVVWSV